VACSIVPIAKLKKDSIAPTNAHSAEFSAR